MDPLSSFESVAAVRRAIPIARTELGITDENSVGVTVLEDHSVSVAFLDAVGGIIGRTVVPPEDE